MFYSDMKLLQEIEEKNSELESLWTEAFKQLCKARVCMAVWVEIPPDDYDCERVYLGWVEFPRGYGIALGRPFADRRDVPDDMVVDPDVTVPLMWGLLAQENPDHRVRATKVLPELMRAIIRQAKEDLPKLDAAITVLRSVTRPTADPT